MICGLLLTVPGSDLACAAAGPFAAMAGGLAAGGAALSVALAVMSGRRGRRLPTWGAVMAALALLLLGAAAGLPEYRPRLDDGASGRLAVVLDLSQSVRRDGAAVFDARLDQLADRSAELQRDVLPEWEGRIFGFGTVGAPLSTGGPLDRLDTRIRAIDAGPPTPGSDLGAGLATALDWIDDGTGAGVVLLLSDGWASGGDPVAQVARAARDGRAIHVLPAGATAPAQGMVSRDIGPDQLVGRDAVVRLTVTGGGTVAWAAEGTEGAPAPVPDGGAAPVAVRLPVAFAQRGLRPVRVALEQSGGRGQVAELFTLVRGPARILALGSARWLDGLPRDRFDVVRVAPGAAPPPSGFDAVVVDALLPEELPEGYPADMLAAAAGGSGVMIVNGPRLGSAEEPQRMAAWEASALGPALPVTSDPATYLREPPKRNILILIDTSGSMVGPYAARAQATAGRIVDLTRPGDGLTVVAFADGAARVFAQATMAPGDLERARVAIGRLSFGGGTDMSAGIAEAARLRGARCDLFVIGDGGYPAGQVRTSPICRTTAIGVAGGPLPGFDTTWGEQIVLQPGEALGDITFETFQPEPRTDFWRDGPLTPLGQDSAAPSLPPMAGVALAFARPEAVVPLVTAEPPRDPVLAYRTDPERRAMTVGAVTGAVPDTIAPEAATALLNPLVGWSDPDRFGVSVGLDGLQMSVRVVSQGPGDAPARIMATLLRAGGVGEGLRLEAGPERGVFAGGATIRRGPQAEAAVLILDAGDGAVQSIPITLPAAVPTPAEALGGEGWDFGINAALLADIAARTGGVDLSRTAPPAISTVTPHIPAWPLWPLLAALGLALFAASLFLGGVRR